jgi:hypothetical protein
MLKRRTSMAATVVAFAASLVLAAPARRLTR